MNLELWTLKSINAAAEQDFMPVHPSFAILVGGNNSPPSPTPFTGAQTIPSEPRRENMNLPLFFSPPGGDLWLPNNLQSHRTPGSRPDFGRVELAAVFRNISDPTSRKNYGMRAVRIQQSWFAATPNPSRPQMIFRGFGVEESMQDTWSVPALTGQDPTPKTTPGVQGLGDFPSQNSLN